jgi:hypothetical protein
LAYGASFPAVFARTADHLDEILEDVDPGELPVELGEHRRETMVLDQEEQLFLAPEIVV